MLNRQPKSETHEGLLTRIVNQKAECSAGVL